MSVDDYVVGYCLRARSRGADDRPRSTPEGRTSCAPSADVDPEVTAAIEAGELPTIAKIIGHGEHDKPFVIPPDSGFEPGLDWLLDGIEAEVEFYARQARRRVGPAVRLGACRAIPSPPAPVANATGAMRVGAVARGALARGASATWPRPAAPKRSGRWRSAPSRSARRRSAATRSAASRSAASRSAAPSSESSKIEELEVGSLEIGSLTVREGLPAPTRDAVRRDRAHPPSALVAALGVARGRRCSAPGRPARSVPIPDLGSCSVFPQPPASTSPTAPSLGTEAAWNQNISKAPRAADSAKVIAYIDSHGGDAIHPDFGSPREYGFPYAVVGAGAKQLPIHYTAYGSESSPGPFPIPADAPVEGGADAEGDRHVLVVDKSTCKLFELYDARFEATPKPHWDADAGVEWDLRSAALRPDGWTSADAAGLPIFPGLVRYEEAAAGHVDHAIRVTMDSTRNAWIHPASHCAGDTAQRRRTADGHATAPQGGLRAEGDGTRRPRDRDGDEGIRPDRRRQRIQLVHLRHQRLALGRRRTRSAEGIPGSAFEVVRSAAAVHAC